MTNAPYTWDEEHGNYQRNPSLEIAWKYVYSENGQPTSITFVGDESEKNFVRFVKKGLRNLKFSAWDRITMEIDLGCLPHELDLFLAAAGLALVWMPVLLSKDDKRIPELMKFEVNHQVFLFDKVPGG
jgi:hypothetical protein